MFPQICGNVIDYYNHISSTDRHFEGYPLAWLMPTLLGLSRAVMANKDIDALAILAAQTPCAAERLIRSDRFWDIKFQGLSIMPKRVKKPNSDDYMLGCVAEEDIEDGDHLVRGRGFWLDKACGPPTRANMGLEEKGRFDTSPDYTPWGINAEFVSAGEENGLRYCLSANCPMSLINDFRNISEAPNAALVLLSHFSVLLLRHFSLPSMLMFR